MLRKGFTLIELLIVITIIAILAGAAIPFVQDYIEDARLSKARSDLDEIKNALIRYELDKGTAYTLLDLSALVGPYLTKAMADPWGTPYVISPESSVVFSKGPDRGTDYIEGAGGSLAGTADDIAVDFRPPLALSKAFYIDANKDGIVNAGDQIKIRFTREVIDNTALVTADFATKVDAVVDGITCTSTGGTDGREALLAITGFTTNPFVPGRDTLNVDAASANCKDNAKIPYAVAGGNLSKQNEVVIKSM